MSWPPKKSGKKKARGKKTAPNTHTRAPTKPRKASTYIRACGSSIKQKLKGEKLKTASEKGQPAGHEPGKSIEKFQI